MTTKFLFLAATLSIAAISCNPKEESHPINHSYKDKLLDKKQEQILSDMYTKLNYAAINSTRDQKTPDSRAYSYDLETLQSYLDFVKREAKEKGYENLGIKIKMGQYPQTGNFDPRLDPAFNGYQTVYLVATGNKTAPKTAQIASDSERKENDTAKAKTSKPGEAEEIPEIPGMDLSNLSPPY